MKRWAWVRWVAVVVTWNFSFSQMVPLAFAMDYLRGEATVQTGAERQLQHDPSWNLSGEVERLQAAARQRAEELPTLAQRAELRVTKVAPSQPLVQAIQSRLAGKVQDGTLTSADVKVDGGQVVLSVEYRDAAPSPRIDRLLVDAVADVVDAQSAVPPGIFEAMEALQREQPPTIPGVSAAFHGTFHSLFDRYGVTDASRQQRLIDAIAPVTGRSPVDETHDVAARTVAAELGIDADLAFAEVMRFATGLLMDEPSPVDLATQQARLANPQAPPLYLGALVPQAASVGALVDSLNGIVELTPEGTVNRVLDEQRLRAETVHQLAAEAFLSAHADVKAAAQWLLRDLGRKLGVAEASAYALHQAKASGRWGQATIPAFNIRTGPPHHTLMALFDSAMEQHVGLLMVEIAKSEQGYAVDIEEYIAQVYAAAIARGYTGPLFIQADHYQVTPADYEDDPKKAVAAMKAHVLRSEEGGMLNVDLDSSTLVRHHIVEQQILPLKVRYTNRYLQTRMAQEPAFAQWVESRGGLKAGIVKKDEQKLAGIFDEQPELRALRHKLWDDLLVVALETAGPQVLQETLGADAMDLPNLTSYLGQLELTIEAEKALYVHPVTQEGRSYNSPELYGLPVVGYHDSLRGVVTPDELKELIGLYRDIQQDNLAVSQELLISIRQFGRERQLPMPLDVSFEEEHTDNEVLVNEHPSSALGAIVFTGLADKMAERAGVEPFTTLALQTGTMHGVGGDPDWGIHVRVNLVITSYDKAGTDQHGTSTINPARFADMPTAGVLSDHLATEYQKYTFAVMAQDPTLVDQIGAFLEGVLFPDRPITDPAIAEKVKNAKGKPSGDKLKKFQAAWEQAMREGEAAGLSRRQVVANLITDSRDLGKVRGKIKDVTKLASKPFAVEISQLPPELKAKNYLQHRTEFSRIFQAQNVVNTVELVREHAGFDATKVVLPPAPTGLVQALRRTVSREEAERRANAELTTKAHRPQEPVPAPGKDNTIGIGVATIHLRGDKSVSKGEKDTAAEDASDAITIARGDVEHVMAIEGALDVGYEELQAGGVHETGFVVNPHGTEQHTFVLRDDIEVTNGFHTNREGRPHDPRTTNPGTTSLRAWGEAVRRHGVVPEKYAAIVAANVPQDKVAEYDTNPLDPFAWDPVDPYEGLLQTITRLTRDSGRAIWDTEVAIMKRGREGAIKKALQRIAEEHVGPNGERLLITEVSDGTVDPARLAMAGRTRGRYLIAIEMGKSTEGTHNWFESGVLRYRGGVLGMRPVSKNINHVMEPGSNKVAVKDGATDHTGRLAWTAEEERDERTFRPHDAEARLAGQALYHQGNVPGDVEIAVGMRTDNPWFNLPGDLDMGDGDTVRVWTMRMSSQAAREGRGDLWIEVDDASRREIGLAIRGAAFTSLPDAAQLSIQTNVIGALIREGLLNPEDQTAIEIVRDAAARVHPEYRGKAIKKLSAAEVVQRIVERLHAESAWNDVEDIVRTLHQPASLTTGARVAINGGAGRIGTNLLRGWLQNPRGYTIVALNDPDFAFAKNGLEGAKAFARLLERAFNIAPRSQLAGTTVAAGQDDGIYWIAIKGHRITLTDNPDPTTLPWAARDIDVVLEATGRFTDRNDAEKHLQSGAKAVIVTAPGKGDLQTVAPGINADDIDPAQTVYSCASCTTNAASAPLKALSDALDIAYVMVPTTHSKTSDQPTLDRLRPEEFGKGMAAGENIAITKSGAGTDIAKLLTKLAGKVDARAIRVPTPNGSLIPMTLEFNQPTTKEQIHELLRAAAEGELKGIMAFEDDGPVDQQSMLGRTESSIINGKLTTVSPTGKVAVIWVWYDNEFGYANRVLDLVPLIQERKAAAADAAPALATPAGPVVETTLADSLKGVADALAGDAAAVSSGSAVPTEDVPPDLDSGVDTATQHLAQLPYLERVEALGIQSDNPARLEEGVLVNQFPEMTQALITPDEAASAVDVRDRRLIIVHSSVFETLDAAAVQERIQQQLTYVEGGAEGAVDFVLAQDSARNQTQAQAAAAAMTKAFGVAFDHAVPVENNMRPVLASLTAAVPGSRIASVVGPRGFVAAVKSIGEERAPVAGVVIEPPQDGKVVSGGNAIRAAVSAAASNEGKPSPVLAGRLNIFEDGDLFVPKGLDMLTETEGAIRRHQEKLQSIKAASEKG